MYRPFFFLACLLLLSGCKVHDVVRRPSPPLSSPLRFENAQGGIEPIGPWWEELGDPRLSSFIEKALCNNFDLRQAWDRLAQARAHLCIVNADRYPQIDLEAVAMQTKSYGDSLELGALGDFEGIQGASGGTVNRYLLGATLNYEIDLFRKIDSRARAACHEYQAARFDISATALLLSGTVAELWLTILEQRALIKLIHEQIKVNQTQVELLELRFSVGESSALDVYQQKLQLAATLSELPPLISTLNTSIYELYTLMGETAQDYIPREEQAFPLSLPPFPSLGAPCSLLCRRPDLRQAEQHLIAADYEVAAAIADRLPKLDLRFSYERSAQEWGEIFNRETTTLIGSLLQPLFDGFRRACEVGRRKSIVCERLHRYGELFLTAIQEVESAVVREKQQLALLEQLEKQHALAKENLLEARWHYMSGINDYLTVIAAIQAVQNVERRLISEKKNLIANRVRLYQALGGPLYECKDP